MNQVDAFVLLLLAIADGALFAYLRLRRRRHVSVERMIASLQLHLRRQTSERTQFSPALSV